ncbi:MAG: c-type cytochrome domain-containing protein [Planctomycetota bacterium]
MSRRFTFVIALLITAWAADSLPAADLDRRERTIVNSIQSSISRAGQNYFRGDFEAAGDDLRKVLSQIQRVEETGSPELYDAIEVHLKKITVAHAMLELEGISLPPFRRPSRPLGDSGETGKPTTDTTVSFVSDVAPILAQKCGQCHIRGARGGFSTANYAALMKGPPEGVVVFANDVIGSRLIETIETGDMPRGGARVTPDELNTLKTWINEGAKFDGEDPTTMLTASPTPTPAPTPRVTPTINRATGKESVSFANQVAPLLVESCSGCHLDAMQTRGGLRMDTFAQLLAGGDSGTMITPGRGEASLLIRKLRGTASDGQRMPLNRPPLSDESISLISKWIDEGATLDADETQPVRVISQLAWAANASSAEKSLRRAELSEANLRLSGTGDTTDEYLSPHFRVIGPASRATRELVASLAENHVKTAKTISRSLPDESPEDYFRGRATIYVYPKRYDYSEFAKMVEGRSVPADWSAHWMSDGIDAYLTLVAGDRDEEEAIEARLLGPVVSLAVAARGVEVPRWFAEGIGKATSLQKNATKRDDKAKLQASVHEAAKSVKDAKAFLGNRLTPEQTDAFGTALAFSMLERNRRRMLESSLRSMADNCAFDEAFERSFGVTPTIYIDQFLNTMR